jgi:predicted RNA-binding Zn-ribbon protein involved in translation (DUF1610 family)
MYCWSCGTPIDGSERICPHCGTARAGMPGAGGSNVSVLHMPRHQAPAQLRSCPACGFRGEGIPYFRRAGNLALLTVASLFTYLVGGAVYWLIKRNDKVCPACGLSWDRSRPLGGAPYEESSGPGAVPSRNGPAGSNGHSDYPLTVPLSESRLPRRGLFRRISGIAMGLAALFFLGIGIIEPHAVPAMIGGLMGLTGAATFGWGWKALHRRREAVMQRLQRRVLLLARRRRGRLTATEVAAELDLTLPAAERLLLSLDDGFRVRSDVSDEGLLYFEFPEIQLTSDAGKAIQEGERGVHPPG